MVNLRIKTIVVPSNVAEQSDVLYVRLLDGIAVLRRRKQ